MKTRITLTSKGHVAQVSWEDGTKINSKHFENKLDAQSWLLDQVSAQKDCVYRESVKKGLTALAAIALIFPVLPALSQDEPLKDPGGRGSGRVTQQYTQYTPPDNGGPTTTGGTGTR